MARPLRIYFDGAWYHVMNRGIHREYIFFNDPHRYAFLSMYRDGLLFKGRFKAIVISADEYLIQLSRYIYLNPAKAKIVTDLSEYTWSSYLAYIGKTKYPTWLTKCEIVKRFGKKSFPINYKQFIYDKSRLDLDDFYQSKNIKSVLGGDDFCRMMDEYVSTHSLSAEIVGKDRILTPLSIKEIADYVTQHFGINHESISVINTATGNPARYIFIYICRQFGGYTLSEISNALGNISYKGISKALTRIGINPVQISADKCS